VTVTAILVVLGALNLAMLVAVLVMVRRLRRRAIGMRKIQEKERHHRLWPPLESLIGLYRLLDGTGDLPSLRLISVSPDFLLHVIRGIQQHAPRRIVECGCGSSTIAMAQALRWRQLYPGLEARSLRAEKGCIELYFRDGGELGA
jgi:hypothetical protein